MILRNSHIAILSILSSFVMYSQTANEILKKMNAQFIIAKTMKFDSKYNLYKTHQSNKVYETYSGFFLKNAKNDIYMRIDKTEFINDKDYSLKINHKEKAMLIQEKTHFSTVIDDVSKLWQFCEVSSLKDFKKYWEIILVPKKLSGLTYSKIILIVNKSYLIDKEIFYYNTPMNFSKDYKNQDSDYPRLEVLYSNYSNNGDTSLINTDSYFLINNGKVIPRAKYKNYQVTDNRNKGIKKNKSSK